MNFNELLTDPEQEAIAVLVDSGFRAFTKARIGDVRELGTPLRRRTHRNRGRYQLVLACRNLENRQLPELPAPPDKEPDDASGAITTTEELQAAYPDLCRQLLQRETTPVDEAGPDPAPVTPPAELKPVDEMLKEELLLEARTYPAITGEHRMNKPELAAAVQTQRDRRALVHRDFGNRP